MSRVNSFHKRNEIHDEISNQYGFKRTVEFESDDELEAYEKEAKLISEYRTFAFGGEGWWGANKNLGGECGFAGVPKLPEHRRKIGLAHKGRKATSEARAAMSRGGKGKVLSEEHKRKIGESGRNRVMSHEEKEARSRGAIEANRRRWSKPITEEQRKKWSELAKARALRRPRGWKLSEETKQKIRATLLNRRKSVALINDQPSVPVADSSEELLTDSSS